MFVIWNICKLVQGFGGPQQTRRILDDFRARVRNAGLGELYIAGVPHNDMMALQEDPRQVNALYDELGLNGGFRYSWLTRKDRFPSQSYEEYLQDGIQTFQDDAENFDIPMEPGVCSGWDPSPRTVQSDMYDNVGYPFATVVTDNRPELFEKVLQEAKAFTQADTFTGHMITISCWNEWTEGSYLEPDTEYGYDMLEAVRKTFGY